MTWSPDELKQLQASSIVDKIGRAEADQMITSQILPVIRKHETVFEGSQRLSDDDLVQLAHRMASTIMAYAFDLEKEADSDDEDEDGWIEDREGKIAMGMVPMADLLNADAQFNAHIDHGDDLLTATALRRISAGEEVLNYYGPLSNGELLRRYGYVTREHARHDVVELPWNLVATGMRKTLALNEKEWTFVVRTVPSSRTMHTPFRATCSCE
jgi:hypothetical protein